MVASGNAIVFLIVCSGQKRCTDTGRRMEVTSYICGSSARKSHEEKPDRNQEPDSWLILYNDQDPRPEVCVNNDDRQHHP